jgi:cytochrome c5
MIYNTVCAACHATGVAEAPIPGSEQMAQRAEKGMEALMQTALNGLNAMPARGGRPDLSDEQVQAVVEFMTK